MESWDNIMAEGEEEQQKCQKLYETIVNNLDEVSSMVKGTVAELMIALLKRQVESLNDIAIMAIQDKHK